MPADAPLTALILAAGEGRRMGGRPKATLDFAGRPALSLVLEAALAGGCDRALVVLGAHAAQVLRVLPPSGDALQVVENDQWILGQTSSLQAGLRALPPAQEGEGVLLFPVDFPLVDAPVVEALVRRWRAIPAPERPARCLPVFVGERGHPIIFNRSVEPALSALPPTETAMAVFGPLKDSTVEVRVDCPFILTDMDTLEEYAELVKHYKERLMVEPG
ncbi:MAG TPA: nucleotidyltransferase family protein [bacterium]|nr:nucleotidyltransferase family protein [bacterium]